LLVSLLEKEHAMVSLTRRSALTLAASSLATGALAQTRIPPLSNAPVTITYYNYNLASAGIGAEGTRELIAEFMARHPNIRVEGVAVASDQILARAQADIAAGRVPDVGQFVFSDLDFVVRNFGVRPLTEIVPPEEWSEHTAGIVPAGLRLGAIGSRIYGLAYVFSTPMLFYNATLFKAAGLDPDAPPRTFADVHRAGLAIRNATGRHGFYPGIYTSFDWLLQAAVLSNGGRTISEDRTRLMFGERETVEMLEIMREMRRAGSHANLRPTEDGDTFMAGNLGMILTTSVYTRAFLAASEGKFEVRATGMPSFGDKPTRPTNSGSALFIMSRDPQKMRASWELVKFMTSRRAFTVITSKIGYVPLRLDIVDDPQYLGEWTKQNPLIRPNLEQLARLNQWVAYPGSNYRQISRILVGAANDAVFGEGNIAEIMREAQTRAQALMPRA
jgi:multiple sugar transport system substrate-binding protein